MNGTARSNWRLRRAGALAVVAAVAVLTTACGVHVHFGLHSGPASTGANYRTSLAYAHCMQTHGVPNFPDPKPSGHYSISGQLNGSRNSPLARANDACRHLLSAASAGAGGATGPATTTGYQAGAWVGPGHRLGSPDAQVLVPLLASYVSS
jgi:hypothetical protein